jgi:hypothetical protein
MHLVALQRGWYRAISMSCVTLPIWHGRGHRFDPGPRDHRAFSTVIFGQSPLMPYHPREFQVVK